VEGAINCDGRRFVLPETGGRECEQDHYCYRFSFHELVRPLRLVISLCDCAVESKIGKIRRVKYSKSALVILAAVSASFALAEDFKTIKGKEYKNAAIIRVESDGIVLKTKTGISKVYFIELPNDVQERFHPSPAKTATAQRQREPIKLEGWAAVMANRTAVVMFFVAGTIIIAGVVFAIVRRRFQ